MNEAPSTQEPPSVTTEALSTHHEDHPSEETKTACQEMYEYLMQHRTVVYETSIANLGNVALSNTSKDIAVTLSSDQISMQGSLGYRTCKASHGIDRGLYYFEVKPFLASNIDMESLQASAKAFRPQWRIGIATNEAEMAAPVGFDRSGYSIRSVDGSVCHNRFRITPQAYASNEYDVKDVITVDFPEHSISSSERDFFYGPGDVIGCLVYLPTENMTQLPREIEYCINKRRAQKTSQNIKHVQETMVNTSGCSATDQDAETPMTDCPDFRRTVVGSFVEFWVNGVSVAKVRDLPYDRYYPAISAYLYGSATINMGPGNEKIPGYPNEWYCLPFTLRPPVISHSSMSEAFQHYAQVLAAYEHAEPGSSGFSMDKIGGFAALYLERAIFQHRKHVQRYHDGIITLELWNSMLDKSRGKSARVKSSKTSR